MRIVSSLSNYIIMCLYEEAVMLVVTGGDVKGYYDILAKSQNGQKKQNAKKQLSDGVTSMDQLN